MRKLRQFIFRVVHSCPERKASRELLAAARSGQTEQYLALAAKYTDLAHAYFGNSLHENRQIRHDRVGQIFTALWQHLPYTERLSDFEYLLAASMIENTPEQGVLHSENPLVTRIRLLSPRVRFAFIAYEFERWSPRWLSLVMRCKPDALHRLLSEARCELCGVSWDSLCQEERDCLQDVSTSIDASPNLRFNKALSARVASYPRVSQIKAQWLELRPELVEIRHRYIPDQVEREVILNRILTDISSTRMQHPPFMTRVFNTVRFSRHGTIKVS